MTHLQGFLLNLWFSAIDV